MADERLAEIESRVTRQREEALRDYGPNSVGYHRARLQAEETLALIVCVRELEAQVEADAKVVDAASMIVSKMTPVEHPSGVVDYAMQGVTNDDWRALVSALAARKE